MSGTGLDQPASRASLNSEPSFTLLGLLVLKDAHCWSISRSPGYLVSDFWLHEFHRL